MSTLRKLLKLMKAVFSTLIHDGPGVLFRKIKRYLFDKMRRTILPELFGPQVTNSAVQSPEDPREFTDVAIISNSENIFESYRSYQLLEVLVANNISAKVIKKSEASLEDQTYANCFILVNIPRSPFWEQFIEKAKSNNKKIYTSFVETSNNSEENWTLVSSIQKIVDGNISIKPAKNEIDKEDLLVLDLTVLQTFNEYRPKSPKTLNIVVAGISLELQMGENINITEIDFKADLQVLFEQDVLFIRDSLFSSLNKIEQETLELMFRERFFKVSSSEEIKNIISAGGFVYKLVDNSTLNQGYELVELVQKAIDKTVAMILPSSALSGGNIVALKHLSIIRDQGYITTVFNSKTNINDKNDLSWSDSGFEPVLLVKPLDAYFKKAIATFWVTLEILESFINCDEKYYLVQSFEPDFYPKKDIGRVRASSTYLKDDVVYVTISDWCVDWMKERYGKEARLVPNGINLDKFSFVQRDFSGKLNLLIEGNCDDEFKNVDLAFKIANELDRERFKITYLSYGSKAKNWYKYDELLLKVPFTTVHEVYQNAHILLKTSTLESFSYPPLEMMATGGLTFALPNQGNKEFLRDNENSILINEDIKETADKLNKISQSPELINKLVTAGLETAKSRDWNKYSKNIYDAYDL